MDVLSAMANGSGNGLAVDNPAVLGPLAGFIFAIFAFEIIVSGRAHRRQLDENARLRAIVENVIPQAQAMTEVAKEMTKATEASTRAMERMLDRLSYSDGGQ